MRSADTPLGVRHFSFGAMDILVRNRDSAYQGGYPALFVSDLPFKGSLLRKGVFQRIPIGAFIDFVEQIARFNQLIVFHIQANKRAIDLWRYSDEVGEDFGVIGARIGIRAVEHSESHYYGAGHDSDTDPASDNLAVLCIHGDVISLVSAE
jgi:hypothetical protein